MNSKSTEKLAAPSRRRTGRTAASAVNTHRGPSGIDLERADGKDQARNQPGSLTLNGPKSRATSHPRGEVGSVDHAELPEAVQYPLFRTVAPRTSYDLF